MREILNDNFEKEFRSIENDFRGAMFFAVDSEFSGTLLSEKLRPSDTIEERYSVQHKEIEHYTIIQIGITAFHFSIVTNTFIPNVYSFYIFPQSFGKTDIDFMCKTSSIEFLRQYNFDFQKLIYHGLPYLAHEYEKEVRSSLNAKGFHRILKESLNIDKKLKIQTVCSEVSEWLASKGVPNGDEKKNSEAKPKSQANEELSKQSKDRIGFDSGSTRNLDNQSSHHSVSENLANHSSLYLCLGSNAVDKNGEKQIVATELSVVEAFIIYHEIIQRFPQVVIFLENNQMRVDIESEAANFPAGSAADPSTEKLLREKLMNSLKGFSRVIDLLMELKKPIIGHNVFSDLLMMCKQFHGALPPTYPDFKKRIHSLFPIVYDTKFLCRELRIRLRRRIKGIKLWTSSSLEELFNYFKALKKDTSVFYCPNILHSDSIYDDEAASGRYHNAAWDSYCAGFVFIRMVHLFATLNVERKFDSRMMSAEEFESYVKLYCNHVNIMRADIKYTVLDGGDDTSSKKTVDFIIQARSGKLDMTKVSQLCSRHGKCQIKPWGKYRAYVSVDTKGTQVGVMRGLKRHPDYKIEEYSLLKHNSYVRSALWAMAILSAVGSGCIIYKAVIE